MTATYIHIPSLKQDVLQSDHLFLAWLAVTNRLTCLKHPHCEYSMDEETGLAGILSPVHSRPSCNTIGGKKLGKLSTKICEIWRNYFSHNPNTEFSKHWVGCANRSLMLKTSFSGWVSIDTLDQHLINNQSTGSQQLAECQLTHFMYQSTLNHISAKISWAYCDSQPRCWLSVNVGVDQLSIQYQSRVLAEDIDQHSTANVFSTHDSRD